MTQTSKKLLIQNIKRISFSWIDPLDGQFLMGSSYPNDRGHKFFRNIRDDIELTRSFAQRLLNKKFGMRKPKLKLEYFK